jgi:hypothetical protein
MSLMNGVFREYLDKFVQVFIDDILIYSRRRRSMMSTCAWYYNVYENTNCMGSCPNALFTNQEFTT